MQISQIEASLNYGRFLTGKRLSVLYCCLVVALLFPLITVLIIITILAGGMDWNSDMLFVLIGGNIFSLFLFGVLLWVMISNSKLKKNILLWIEDAIKTKGFVKSLNAVSPKFKPYQIQVDFEIDDKEFHRISAPGNIIRGYHKVFLKYVNKKINILYSPKYDQVLFLKTEL